MALSLTQNFDLKSTTPNFARDQFKTLADMKAYPETSLPDGHLAYNLETKQTYQYKSGNTADASTGKWRVFAPDMSDYVTSSQLNLILNLPDTALTIQSPFGERRLSPGDIVLSTDPDERGYFAYVDANSEVWKDSAGSIDPTDARAVAFIFWMGCCISGDIGILGLSAHEGTADTIVAEERATGKIALLTLDLPAGDDPVSTVKLKSVTYLDTTYADRDAAAQKRIASAAVTTKAAMAGNEASATLALTLKDGTAITAPVPRVDDGTSQYGLVSTDKAQQYDSYADTIAALQTTVTALQSKVAALEKAGAATYE